jgi:hypothetical protein
MILMIICSSCFFRPRFIPPRHSPNTNIRPFVHITRKSSQIARIPNHLEEQFA